METEHLIVQHGRELKLFFITLYFNLLHNCLLLFWLLFMQKKLNHTYNFNDTFCTLMYFIEVVLR